MEPCRPRAVETEPPDQHHAGDGVLRLGDARPGEVVVDEPLGVEAAEEPLNDPVLEVEVAYLGAALVLCGLLYSLYRDE